MSASDEATRLAKALREAHPTMFGRGEASSVQEADALYDRLTARLIALGVRIVGEPTPDEGPSTSAGNASDGTRSSVARWLEEHRVDVSDLRHEDIVGIGHVTAEVAGLVARLREPARAEAMGVEIPRGILFYGAPGLGKTLVARSPNTNRGRTAETRVRYTILV